MKSVRIKSQTAALRKSASSSGGFGFICHHLLFRSLTRHFLPDRLRSQVRFLKITERNDEAASVFIHLIWDVNLNSVCDITAGENLRAERDISFAVSVALRVETDNVGIIECTFWKRFFLRPDRTPQA